MGWKMPMSSQTGWRRVRSIDRRKMSQVSRMVCIGKLL